MSKIKYFLVLILLVLVLNFVKVYFKIEDNNTQFVEVNEVLVFQNENEENNINKNLNNASFEDLLKIGLSSNNASLIIDYISFLGKIDNVNMLKNIKLSKKNIELVAKNFEISSEKIDREYVKYDIKSISEDELYLLGFNKKDVEKILSLKDKAKSNLDLKDVSNQKLIKKHIKY